MWLLILALLMLPSLAGGQQEGAESGPSASASASGATLDAALLNDLLPPISARCIESAQRSTGVGTFNLTYVPYPGDADRTFSANAWRTEKTHLYQATMSYHDSQNTNTSWTIRIGTGGNIYSLIGPFGEAIPPQLWDFSPFVDEVWQAVPTDLSRNKPGKDKDGIHGHWFVHQAGSYKWDPPYTNDQEGGGGPMYGPSIAHYCTSSDGITVCTFASWGQHGWIPTFFSSPIIFVTRYAICGDGVLETTYAVHNMMTGRTNRKSDQMTMAPMTAAARTHNNHTSRRRLQPMVDWADDEIEETPVSIGIISLPWGGVRTSTLRDVVISRPDGSLLDSPPPRPQGFGDPRGHAPRARDTGGFTIFAQDLPHPDNTPEFVLPCRLPDGQTVDFCSKKQMIETPGATRPIFIVGQDNPAHLDISWSRPWQDVIGLELQKTTPFHQSCLECQLQLTNPRTNATFPIKSVKYFIYQGTRFVFSPQNQGIGALDKLNSIFKAGDTIEITLADRGLKPEDNLALTHVHGTDEEYNGSSYFRMPTGIRYGLSHHVRDYTVWTVNAFPKIDPGDTFVSRQYFMVNRYTKSARKAQEWVPETLQEQYDAGELPGNEIHLYAENGGVSFGAIVGDEACARGREICTGSTVPTGLLRALFQVQCAGESFIGWDRYHFSPPSSKEYATPLRSYVCINQAIDVRPRFKLLGYFPEGECDILNGFTLDESFCSTVADATAAAVSDVDRNQASLGANIDERGQASSSTPKPLARILLEDNMVGISERCPATSQIVRSTRSSIEEDAGSALSSTTSFLATLSHTDSRDDRYSWQMKVGRGGNIISFEGAYGEAISAAVVPQNVVQVQSGSGDERYFASQASSSSSSPSVASHCGDTSCSFASLGQELNGSTGHDEGDNDDVIFFVRYANCGDGVIEETVVIHNAANPDRSEAPSLSSILISQRDFRTSTFRNILAPDPSGDSMDFMYTPFPETKTEMNDSGGFITLTENLRNPSTPVFDLPCWHPDLGAKTFCNTSDIEILGFEHARFVVASEDFCVSFEDGSHTGRLSCAIEDVVPEMQFGCSGCRLLLVNRNTNRRIEVHDIYRWATAPPNNESGTKQMVIKLVGSAGAPTINSIFEKGAEIGVEYVDWGDNEDENNALTVVYGEDEPSDITWSDRDRTVSTIGFGRDISNNRHQALRVRSTIPAKVQPGNSFVKRQYLLSGPYTGMREKSERWVGEVHQANLDQATYASLGRAITLYSNAEGTVFGAVATGGYEKCRQDASRRCSGYSVPRRDSQAVWYTQCGSEHYVGTEKQKCTNDENQKPVYTLLGFFEEKCEFLHRASFDESFCSISG